MHGMTTLQKFSKPLRLKENQMSTSNEFRSLVVCDVEIYIETDEEGFKSISTDGYISSPGFNKLIAALEAMQTDSDRCLQQRYNEMALTNPS